MASGLASFDPPRTPPTPATLPPGLGDEDDGRFVFTCDDYDGTAKYPDANADADTNANTNTNNTNANLRAAAAFPDPDRFLATSPRSSPAAFLHPHHVPSLRPRTPESAFTMSENGLANGHGAGSDAPAARNPFNFETQFIATAPVKSNIGQRRGHRYKHSSISVQHSFFQEPPPRPPPVLPASLPIPTMKEAWGSMQTNQRARLYWSCCHAAVAVYIFFSAEDSLAMTALSHLVFFDVGSAAVCVAVDVLGNFEVWRRSSIRHPFGLQRAEVLAGFAMSVFLVFGGFDLLSHNLKHVLESVGEHAPHHPHTHGGGGASFVNARAYITPGTVDTASLAAVVSTLVSAYGLRNHSRIRRVMRVPLPYLSSILPGSGILANPFHFLTLCFSFLMLLLPLVSIPYFVWLDSLICAAIAGSMFVLGTRLAIAQGLMLLMSYSGLQEPQQLKQQKTDSSVGANNSSVSAVVQEIEAEPQVARVEEAQFWQVHYGLAMANLKVCLVRGLDDSALSQLRSRLARVVQNRLGEGYGRGGNLRWEVTVQMSADSGN
ncbi:cation efflux family-domain-containing protein [Lasiosphaeria miniovina]|uniref:Zinc transporter n=1 Tax=Lasiosphaeria miniovina TaxID=1954250 RepID=A0AA40B5J0_9PEZI|nr:cation efflux family-domain-containing protein [Lasiosphaeria miniovina]KAK0728037.1 cation efflux family-domain-containing protein [Lasiosphaeria miniovina]